METFTRGVIEADYVHTFVSREPEATLRLMTTRAGVVQRRIVAKIQGSFRTRWTAGAPVPPMELPDLAYVVTRIGDVLYEDLISGDEPDATEQAAAVAALLRRAAHWRPGTSFSAQSSPRRTSRRGKPKVSA